MASFMIHLAATNEYLKNHDIDNKEDFILGVLAVDLAQDRIKSHYTKYTDKTDLLKFLSGKVSLEDYLHENTVDNDYDRGIFFHLVTDYEFYTSFLNKEKIERINYTTFKEYIYHDYESVNDHIKSKYGVILPESIKKYDISNGDDNCYLIDRNELDNFITSLGCASLDDYMNAIVERKKITWNMK